MRRSHRKLKFSVSRLLAVGRCRMAACLFAGGVAILATNAVLADETGERERGPNIVFFLVDDLGWADLGCYGNGFNETPHIDRLAAGGMRFTGAYAACPVCSPTRASILSGKYPATLNLTDFISGHWRPYEKLAFLDFRGHLPLEEVTLAEALDPGGYASAMLGKWHLGGGPKHRPQRHGFDRAIVSGGGRHFGNRLSGDVNAKLAENEYLADRLTGEAIRFIREHRDRPFFLYLSHYAVHIPLEAQPDKIVKYESKKQRRGGKAPCHPTYSAMLESVDDSLGRVVATLAELGLNENTVVIFTSDNGGLRQHYRGIGPIVTSNAPLRAEKGTLYEGGIRVPTIVKYPGTVKAGSTCHTPVSSVDFYPTILELTGIERDPKHTVDGVSLAPLLNESGELEREAIYWHYPHYHHSTPAGAVRSGDWKLIEFYEDGKLELYNLADDLGEENNLAEAMPDKARELQARLAAWRNKVDAQMPEANPDFDPKRRKQWGDKRLRKQGGKKR